MHNYTVTVFLLCSLLSSSWCSQIFPFELQPLALLPDHGGCNFKVPSSRNHSVIPTLCSFKCILAGPWKTDLVSSNQLLYYRYSQWTEKLLLTQGRQWDIPPYPLVSSCPEIFSFWSALSVVIQIQLDVPVKSCRLCKTTIRGLRGFSKQNSGLKKGAHVPLQTMEAFPS